MIAYNQWVLGFEILIRQRKKNMERINIQRRHGGIKSLRAMEDTPAPYK